MELFNIGVGNTARDLRQLIIDRDRLFYGLNTTKHFGQISGTEQYCTSKGVYKLLGEERIHPGISMHTESARIYGLKEDFNAQLFVIYITNGHVRLLKTHTILKSDLDFEKFNRNFLAIESRKGHQSFRYLVLYKGLESRNEVFKFRSIGKEEVLFPVDFSFERQEVVLRQEKDEQLQALENEAVELLWTERCTKHGILLISRQCKCAISRDVVHQTLSSIFATRELRKDYRSFRNLTSYCRLESGNRVERFQDFGKKIRDLHSKFSSSEKEEERADYHWQDLEVEAIELLWTGKCTQHGMLLTNSQCKCSFVEGVTQNVSSLDAKNQESRREVGRLLNATTYSGHYMSRVPSLGPAVNFPSKEEVQKKTKNSKSFLKEFRKLCDLHAIVGHELCPTISASYLEEEEDIAARIRNGEHPSQVMDWGDSDYVFEKPMIIGSSFFEGPVPVLPYRQIGLSFDELRNERLVRDAIRDLEQDVQEVDAYDLYTGCTRPSITAKAMMDRLLRYVEVLARGEWAVPIPYKVRRLKKPPDKE